jgi:hypothetical protein
VTGEFFPQLGASILLAHWFWYPALLPAFLSAVAAAIAVIAWHFRKDKAKSR